jgi:phospholipase C
VLKGIGAAVGAAAIGCGDDSSAGSPDARASADGAPLPPDARPLPDAAPPDAAYDACAADSGLSAAELLAPIETIVVLCMENRSYDHYLGALTLEEGRADLDGLTGIESNPDPDGNPVGVHVLDDFTPADPPHGWDACHNQWNGGANDGFVIEHAGPSQADVMGYHLRSHLPVTYALADASAICDRWFSSVLGPTWPNRYYLHGASSNGIKTNLPALGFQSILGVLDDAGISNTNYFHDLAWASGGYFKLAGLAGIERFFEQAAAGELPQFSIIDPQFFGSGANDDHPDHDIRLGQALIGSVFAALAQGPQWNRCLFVLTYDEHGGFYDHVAPPTTVDEREDFRQLGIRVPSLVAGPFVRRGCAVKTTLEHSSVIATLTTRFGLAPMNDRVAATADLSSCIDAATLGDPQPPPVLPEVEISRSAIRRRPAVTGAHAELAAAVRARPLPRHLDRRDQADAITERVLAWGQRLGAVRLLD